MPDVLNIDPSDVAANEAARAYVEAWRGAWRMSGESEAAVDRVLELLEQTCGAEVDAPAPGPDPVQQRRG